MRWTEEDTADRTAGAAGVIADLYERHRSELAAFFRRRHPDPATAEDLVQETFARLVRCSNRLLGARSPRAFLFGIARHVSLDAWRRAAVRAIVQPRPALDTDIPASSPSVPAHVCEALAELPPVDREVLELRFQHDLSYVEIAEALRCPIGTVRSRLHRALRRLREAWEAAGPGDRGGDHS